MKNNRASVSGRDTLAISALLSDPVLSREIAEFKNNGEIAIVAINPASTHDISLYRKLYNSPELFDVMSESEHATRDAALIIVRYRQKTEETLGKSSLELKTDKKK